ncbi:hypothetical protein [Hydrogenophaga sp.]|uniref:hypothetical protein n=1 Tax=Hydrogenophaga sp. TaxID=1904254 RepID=UPI002FC669DD
MTRSELEDVRAYARLTTELILSEARKHEAHVASAVSELSQDEREAYFENNSDTYELLVRRFPNQQQQSLLALAYTVVETRLVGVAKTLLRTGGTGLTLKDLAGDSPFQKSRKVITKVSGLVVQQSLWDEVDAYRLIRNAIVHSAGDLGQEPRPLVKQLLLARSTEIQNSEIGGLTVQPTFVFSFLEASEKLFEAVFERWIAAEDANTA